MRHGRYVMAIDAGMRGVGACLYDPKTRTLADVRGLRTEAKRKVGGKKISVTDDDYRRVSAIFAFLDDVGADRVIAVLAEIPAGSQSARAAKMAGIAKIIPFAWARQHKIPFKYYFPTTTKKAATGDRYAEKEAVQDAVTKRWPMVVWPLGEKHFEDCCDAAAVLIAADQDGTLAAFA